MRRNVPMAPALVAALAVFCAFFVSAQEGAAGGAPCDFTFIIPPEAASLAAAAAEGGFDAWMSAREACD